MASGLNSEELGTSAQGLDLAQRQELTRQGHQESTTGRAHGSPTTTEYHIFPATDDGIASAIPITRST